MKKLLAALLLGATATIANANNYIATFEGVLVDGSDDSNLFGLAGSSLVGQSFKLVATASAPVFGGGIGGDGSTYANYYGSTYYGYTGPSPLSVMLTVNNQTVAFVANPYDPRSGNIEFLNEYQGDQDGVEVGFTSYQDDTTGTKRYNYIKYIEISGLARTADLIDSLLPTNGFSHVQDRTAYADTGGGAYSISYDGISGSSGTMQTNRFSLQIAPVPEPGEWAMMLGGLAIVGGAVRRRRS